MPRHGDSKKVKVSPDDTVAGYLIDKLAALGDISQAIVNPGEDEQITVGYSSSSTDEFVKVSGADTTAGSLTSKMVPGSGVAFTINSPGDDETLTISMTGVAATVREDQPLVGLYDSNNRDFYLPNNEHAIYDPPRKTIKVYHNGRRLQQAEYAILESVPGEGHNLVRLLAFAPHTSSRLTADYVIV